MWFIHLLKITLNTLEKLGDLWKKSLVGFFAWWLVFLIVFCLTKRF